MLGPQVGLDLDIRKAEDKDGNMGHALVLLDFFGDDSLRTWRTGGHGGNAPLFKVLGSVTLL